MSDSIEQRSVRPDAAPSGRPDSAGAGARLVVLVPAYNEEEGVGPTLRRLRQGLEGIPAEIVVIDDGSTDATAAAAEETGARVLRLGANHGYGAALRTGILATDAELVGIIDADGSYPAADFHRLVGAADEADMVVGTRPEAMSNVPAVRRPAKRFLRWLASYLAGRPIPDLNSGMRLMRRSALEQFLPILPDGFSFTTTVTLAFHCTGRRVAYEPIDYHQRIGRSKIRPIDFTAFLILVLRTILLFNPLKVFLPLGALLFLAGVVKLAYDVYLWNLSESAVMAFLAAVILWAVGLLADMIARLQLGSRRLH